MIVANAATITVGHDFGHAPSLNSFYVCTNAEEFIFVTANSTLKKMKISSL